VALAGARTPALNGDNDDEMLDGGESGGRGEVAIGNAIVTMVLRSPLHRMLSGSTDVIRYTGRRTGRVFTTPTQYASSGDDIVIMVARAASKQWWRNFTDERDLDVLVRRTWRPMRARAVIGAHEPETVRPLLDAYLARFPRMAKFLSGETEEERIRHAVVVWCRPR
jgi:hypothetical protein